MGMKIGEGEQMKVQLTCPYCKQEFPFDNGWIDKEYEEAKREFQECSREITGLKALPWKVQKQHEGKIKALGIRIQDAQARCTALKKVRKLKDQQLNSYMFHIFKGLVRDEVGEKRWKELLDEAQKELEAYELSGLMWHEYTISRSKTPVTSINKL